MVEVHASQPHWTLPTFIIGYFSPHIKSLSPSLGDLLLLISNAVLGVTVVLLKVHLTPKK